MSLSLTASIAPLRLVLAALTFVTVFPFGAPGLLAADEAKQNRPATTDEVVELPKITVKELPMVPDKESWRYTKVGSFDVLSNGRDGEARRILYNFEMFRMALSVVWPVPMKSTSSASIILCGAKNKFDEFLPKTKGTDSESGVASLFFRDREHVAIIVDTQTKQMTLTDLDNTAAGFSDVEVDANKQLYRKYVNFILSQSEATLPAWLQEGLSQIIMDMDVDERGMTFGRIEARASGSVAPSLETAGGEGEESETAVDAGLQTVPDQPFNQALLRRRLMDWDRFFAVKADSPEARATVGNTLFGKQAYAFVHMCLYGRGKIFQKGFAQLVQRSSQGPITEAVFKECFGMDYRKFSFEIRGYLSMTDHESIDYFAKKGTRLTPEIPDLREATEPEIAQIKGEALRLAGHRDRARLAYYAPYVRGDHDPRILTGLGMEELAAGNKPNARKFLEAAIARGKLSRSTACLELARFRLQDAEAAGMPNGKLSPEQTAKILQPLLQARDLRPQMPEIYDTIANVWLLSSAKPTADDLKVLEDTARFFPRATTILVKAARIHLEAGSLDRARAIAAFGVQTARDPALKAELESIVAKLPPPPAKK